MSSPDPTSRTSAARRLHHDQRVARQGLAADDASSGLLEAAETRARDTEGRPQPERTRRQHREAGGEEQRGGIQACRGESRNGRAAKTAGDGIRRGTDQERNAGPRDERADRASRGRQQQRLRRPASARDRLARRRGRGARPGRAADSPLAP